MEPVSEVEDTLDRDELEEEGLEILFEWKEREGLRLVGVGGSVV